MRCPKGIVKTVLPGLLSLALVAPLVAQPVELSPKKAQESLANAVEFKGEAKVSVHPYKMEKGSTYRLTVHGKSFQPQVRIEDQPIGVVGSPTSALNGNAPRTVILMPNPQRNSAQMLFMPPTTKEYRIKVDAAPSLDLGKGPHPYTLTIEKAVFQPQLALNDPRLNVTDHVKKLEKGKVYAITVTGRGFAPEVQVLEGTNSLLRAFNGRWYGFGAGAEFVTNLTFAPAKSADYRIVVGVGPIAEQRKAFLTYTTQIVELNVELTVNDQLTPQAPIDPRRGGPQKVHTVKLEAGKKYQIDMISRAFDAYLFLEDSAGKLLMEDDDGGEGLNARMIFRATKTDTYRIMATTFNRGVPTNGGAYTLTVVENPHAQPRFGALSSASSALDFPND